MTKKISKTIVMHIAVIITVLCQLDINIAAPPSIQSTPPRNYWRRNRLANRTIPCTDQEKNCFKNDMVWYPPNQRCYSPFERGPCREDQWIVVDKEKALTLEGHVVGKCEPNVTRLCPPRRILMAFDGGCVLGIIACGGAPVSLDVFGEGECKAPEDAGPALLPVELPSRKCGTPISQDDYAYLHVINPQTRQNCVQDNSGKCVREAKIKYEVFFD